jgi:hypothetical protein
VVSVNIIGPFDFDVFEFKGHSETIIQPIFATKCSGANETNVHIHVKWPEVRYCRIWRVGSPNIDQDMRICSFREKPADGERCEELELFWFYAFCMGDQANPLCEELPPKHGKFSETRILRDGAHV